MFSGGFAATDAASAALSEGRQRKALRNVTDIEDRIMAAAEAEGVATEVIARWRR
jgi:cysteinyl-tRNA synthetase